MKVTKEQLVEIISEEIQQVLNEQALNEQFSDEPFNPRQPLGRPYPNVGVDKKYAYVLNGRANKDMDTSPSFMQKIKTKFGGRDPVLDQAMKRLHNVEYFLFYRPINGTDEERAEKMAYRKSKEAFNEFWEEIRNLKDTRTLRVNQGMSASKKQRAELENLIDSAEERRQGLYKKSESQERYKNATQKALDLQKKRKYKEANELIDDIIAGVESGELDNSGRPYVSPAYKTDDRGNPLKGEDDRYIGK